MQDPKVQKYMDLWKELDNNFRLWQILFKDVTDFILPRRGKYIGQGQSAEGGEKKHTKIYDGTATRAIRFLAAGIQGSLTSPARPWFRLLPTDIQFMKSSAVRQWLQIVENQLYKIYADTNFYQCIHTVYEEEAGFGTGLIYQEEDWQKICRFEIITGGEYRVATNAFGIVDTIARVFYMAARQMVQKFGLESLSKTIQDAYKNTPNKSFEVLQIIRPNDDRKFGKIDSMNKSYESVYIEFGGENKLIAKKGYDENPYACPRWSVTGNESYGGSPAHDLLADVKMLQSMSRDFALAIHKTLDPPMNVPSSMKDTFDGLPGGINWVDPSSAEQIKPTYQINFDLQSTQGKIEDLRLQIKQGLYNDLFLMISQAPGIQPKNQLEIMQLQEEKLIMLGPVIERQFHEALDPILQRTVNLAARAGIIPPPPPEFANANVKVEYVSFLAQAQKKIGTQSINSTVSFVANLVPVFPEAADKVDVDKTIDAFAEMVGSPQEIIRNKDEVAKIRQIRQESQQLEEAKQAAEIMATAGKGAKQLAGADTSGQNALTDMLKKAGGTGG